MLVCIGQKWVPKEGTQPVIWVRLVETIGDDVLVQYGRHAEDRSFEKPLREFQLQYRLAED